MCLQCAYGRVFRDNDQKPSICLEVQEYQDAEFIVNARADLPRMAKEVLRLRALCGEAYERLNEEATSYAMVTSSRVHPNTEELLDKLKAAAEGK